MQMPIKIRVNSGQNCIINCSHWQREFFHLEFKTVNHRTTLDSHIPDIKPRVKNSAVLKAVYVSPYNDQSGTAQSVPQTLHQLPSHSLFFLSAT